ncbi:MAG: FeoB-associated Cys-rich membrane protein [Bacteroidota bacterium]
MNIQIIIVGILIAAAAFYVVRTIYKSTKGHSCETGSCKHVSKSIKKV